MAKPARLVTRQNGRRAIALFRAISVAHRRAQRAHVLSLLASVGVATLGILTRVAPAAAPTVAVIGATWAATYTAVVMPWAARQLRMGATLQETLACELFDLPFNRVAVGEPVAEHETSELGRQFRGEEAELKNYYVIANVPAPYDVLFCLEQDLGWGSRIRLRYAGLLLTLALAWTGVGLLLGLFARLDIVSLIGTWFVPSLGLLVVCVDNYRAQTSNGRERRRVMSLVLAAGEDPATKPLIDGPAWTAFARQVQDVLFHARTQQPRTPSWFFRRWHDRDKADFEYRKQRFEARINAALGGEPPDNEQ